MHRQIGEAANCPARRQQQAGRHARSATSARPAAALKRHHGKPPSFVGRTIPPPSKAESQALLSRRSEEVDEKCPSSGYSIREFSSAHPSKPRPRQTSDLLELLLGTTTTWRAQPRRLDHHHAGDSRVLRSMDRLGGPDVPADRVRRRLHGGRAEPAVNETLRKGRATRPRGPGHRGTMRYAARGSLRIRFLRRVLCRRRWLSGYLRRGLSAATTDPGH